MSSPPQEHPVKNTVSIQSTATTHQDLMNQKLLALRKQKEEELRRKTIKAKKRSANEEGKKSFFQPPRKSIFPIIPVPIIKPPTATFAVKQLKLMSSVKNKEPELEELPPPTAPPKEVEQFEKLIKLEKENARSNEKKGVVLPPEEDKPPTKPKSAPALSSINRKQSARTPLPQIDFVSSKQKNNKLNSDSKLSTPPATPKPKPIAEEKPPQTQVSVQTKTGTTNISVNVTIPKAPEVPKDDKTVPIPEIRPLPKEQINKAPALKSSPASHQVFDKAQEPSITASEKTQDSLSVLQATKQDTSAASVQTLNEILNPQKSKIIQGPSILSLQPVQKEGRARDSVTILQFATSWDKDLDKAGEAFDDWGTNRRGFAIERAPETTKPMKPTDSDLDILRPGKDEADHVTIIPADESKIVDQELAKWKQHRTTFLVLCGVALILGVVLSSITLYSSLEIYKLKTADGLDFLMHTDVMTLASTTLSAVGILIFRLFPDAKKHHLIRAHITIFTIIYGGFIFAYVMAFKMHEEVTEREEHLYTVHSLVGIMIIGFLVFVTVSGIYLVFRPNSPSKRYHWSVGMITFMLCGAGCVAGYLARATNYERKTYLSLSETIITNSAAVIIIIFCCLVRYLETEFRFRRRSCPEWDSVFARTMTSFEEDNAENPTLTLQRYVRMALRERHHHDHRN